MGGTTDHDGDDDDGDDDGNDDGDGAGDGLIWNNWAISPFSLSPMILWILLVACDTGFLFETFCIHQTSLCHSAC